MSELELLTIKAKFKGVIRRLNIKKNISYECLHKQLRNGFGINNCQLQYNDEEGDSIELGSEEELREAFKVAKKNPPLKIKLISDEEPIMTDLVQEPNKVVPSTAAKEPLFKIEEDINMTSSSESLFNVQQISNEKSLQKRKQSSKRIGFYSSLCRDMGDLEISSSESKDEDSRSEFSSKKDKKQAKKENSLRGSKYYKALAEDIIASQIESSKDDETSLSNVTPSSDMDMSGNEEQPPPKWFIKAFNQMSESMLSKFVDELNNAKMATSTEIPTSKPALKRQSDVVHEGIKCNSCQQTIKGIRYKCGNCPDFDLCEDCEAIEGIHNPSHVFLKLRNPGVSIGQKHGVMIPLLKNLLYKDSKFAAEDKQVRELRRTLKQKMAVKKREEQVAKKKSADKAMKKHAGKVLAGQRFFGLKVIDDGDYPAGTEIVARNQFTKSWLVINSGKMAWDEDTKLIFVSGSLKCLAFNETSLPRLKPGEQGTATVPFVAPVELGEYTSVWRAMYKGSHFGNKLFCKIRVVPEPEKSDDEEEDVFVDACNTSIILDDPKDDLNPMPGVAIDEILTADAHVIESSSQGPTLSSDAAIIESNDLEWDTCLINDHDPPVLVQQDDGFEIEEISDDGSDDFCVIPLPACFNPDIPLSTDDPEYKAHLDADVEYHKVYDEINVNTVSVDDVEDESLEEQAVFIPPQYTSAESNKQLPLHIFSKPINIEAKNEETLPAPTFDPRTAISKPHAPQPLSFERNPIKSSWLSASPPGRAVPVLQNRSGPSNVSSSSSPDIEKFHTPLGNESQPVRTQPPDVSSAPQTYLKEKTVTIQPQPTSKTSTSDQSAANLTSTVGGTIKRALGTVTNTVTSLMTGKDETALNGEVLNSEKRAKATSKGQSRSEHELQIAMKQLEEMGFHDHERNKILLKQFNLDVSMVVTKLF